MRNSAVFSPKINCTFKYKDCRRFWFKHSSAVAVHAKNIYVKKCDEFKKITPSL